MGEIIISFDIPMFNTPWGGVRVEEGYLVTEGGAEEACKSTLHIITAAGDMNTCLELRLYIYYNIFVDFCYWNRKGHG